MNLLSAAQANIQFSKAISAHIFSSYDYIHYVSIFFLQKRKRKRIEFHFHHKQKYIYILVVWIEKKNKLNPLYFVDSICNWLISLSHPDWTEKNRREYMCSDYSNSDLCLVLSSFYRFYCII